MCVCACACACACVCASLKSLKSVLVNYILIFLCIEQRKIFIMDERIEEEEKEIKKARQRRGG